MAAQVSVEGADLRKHARFSPPRRIRDKISPDLAKAISRQGFLISKNAKVYYNSSYALQSKFLCRGGT
jgi:hypothetical protein